MDPVKVTIPDERIAPLATQFEQHNLSDKDNFYGCVCEDCALYRLWFVTTVIMGNVLQQRMSIVGRLVWSDMGRTLGAAVAELQQAAEMEQDTELADAVEQMTAPCAHCQHVRRAELGEPMPGNRTKCCWCEYEVAA